MLSRKVKIVTWLILVGALVLRVYKLDWGNGYFFHPDENNMAWGINRLGAGNWNPHFFAYGQFPLYLGYLTIRLLGWDNGMSQAMMVLRGWSVVWSVLTVWGIMKLTQSLTENSRLSLVAGLLACFVPGLIQIAHFGTTESLLTLVMVMSTWAGVEIYKGNNRAFWWGAIIVGVGRTGAARPRTSRILPSGKKMTAPTKARRTRRTGRAVKSVSAAEKSFIDFNMADRGGESQIKFSTHLPNVILAGQLFLFEVFPWPNPFD